MQTELLQKAFEHIKSQFCEVGSVGFFWFADVVEAGKKVVCGSAGTSERRGARKLQGGDVR